jgi:formate-dependent nitrite reductase membrane component NrfD
VGDDLKDFVGDAPWASAMSHKPDPNRVRQLQMPALGTAIQRPTGIPADPATAAAATVPAQGIARAYDPDLPRDEEPSYYDIPMLKSPLWKWEIAVYFFLGGLSAGAHLLGRAAERAGHGGKAGSDVSRIASYLSFLSILPCPPLLIHDLGDPKRFHHMLRVFKPSSPMNLGTWAITAYSGAATSEVIRQYLNDKKGHLKSRELQTLHRALNDGKLLLVQDAVGLPMALLVASYTGELLSSSSNPLWSKNPWLSPLFTASAISCGAEAIMLWLDAKGKAGPADPESHRVLRTVDTLAHAIELTCLAGFNKHAGEKAKPLHEGKMRKWHVASHVGIIGSEVLKYLPLPRFLAKPQRMLSNLSGLAGGFAMRWAFVFGGIEAAKDPRQSRLVSDPNHTPSS